MSEKTYEMSLLYDFFGDFLTDKQKEYFDLYYNEDLSLSEIAQNVGISRQGVRDIIVRAEKTLMDAEKKTGIIKRFFERNNEINRIADLASKIATLCSGNETIETLADELCKSIAELKN